MYLCSQFPEMQMKNKWFGIALALAVFTVVYNLAEGAVSIFFGISDESFTLFGFGADSLIEVVSGLGILRMILRIRQEGAKRSSFEREALRITGMGFFVLAGLLIVSSGYYLYTKHKPETTFWGIVIALISIMVMWLLFLLKLTAGRRLASDAIIADAHCTKVCIYMSVVLLVSSLIYKLAGVGWIDSAGMAGLAWFSFSEGKECFGKIRNNRESCNCHQ